MMKNKKTCSILLVLCFLFPLFNTFIDVRGNQDNFYAISESNNPTQWILQGNDTLEVVFHDDININYWDLYNVSENSFKKNISEASNYLLDNFSVLDEYSGMHFDVGVQSSDPYGITWDGSNFWVVGENGKEVFKYYANGTYTGDSFGVWARDSIPRGITWDGTHLWVVGANGDNVFQHTMAGVYTGTEFYVGAQDNWPCGITWDGTYFYILGMNHDEIYKYTSAGVYTGTHFSVRTQDSDPYGITWDGSNFWVVGNNNDEIYQYTSTGVYTGIHLDVGAQDTSPRGIAWDGTHLLVVGDNNNEVYKYKYELEYDISKNYFGDGYMYFQTNKQEEIGLISSVYNPNISLSSADYFEIYFETNSDSEIKLELINDGLEIKELVLSSNQMFLNETIEFDQIRFSSLFNDQDYLIIYDIKCYNITIIEHYTEFYVEPFQSHSIYLTPATYSLKILEDGEIKRTDEIIISEYEPFYYTYYSEPIQCQLFLFSTVGSQLDIENLHIKINRSVYGVYNDFWLSDTLFYADEGYNITFIIYDQFDSYVSTFEKIATEIINLEIEVYSLIIKNTMNEEISILINSTHSYLILPYENITLFLKKSDYQINYSTNLGNGGSLITLNQNSVYEINASMIPKSINITYIDSNIGYNDIEWTSTGDIEYVLIELYNGTSFVEIISLKTKNDGYYSWCILSNHTYKGDFYQIKIRDYDNVLVYTFSGFFTIEEGELKPEEKPNILPIIIITLLIISVAFGLGIYVIYRKRKRKDIE